MSKRASFSSSLILVFGLALSACGPRLQTKLPRRLVVGPMRVSGGQIYRGETPVFKVGVKNQSDSAMKILRLETSCQCLRWLSPPGVVEAGKEADLDFCFESANFPGKIQKELVLEAEDETGIHPIEFEAEVIPAAVYASGFVLATQEPGQKSRLSLEMQPGPKGEQLELESVECQHPSLQYLGSTAQARGLRLDFQVVASRYGPFRQDVTIRLSKPARVTESFFVEYTCSSR